MSPTNRSDTRKHLHKGGRIKKERITFSETVGEETNTYFHPSKGIEAKRDQNWEMNEAVSEDA